LKEDTCEYHDCLYSDESFDESVFRLKRILHHIDGNHGNNDPKNLMQMHLSCHVSFHNKERWKDPEYAKYMSEAVSESWDEERIKKYSEEKTGRGNPFYGRKHSEESRRKMSESHKGEMTGEDNPMFGVCRFGRDNHMYGKHHSEESKKKISEALSGKNNPNYGKRFSEEHRKKISEARTGTHLSEITKQKISESSKGRKAWNEGKHLSEEHKRRISESMKGRKAWNAGEKLSEEHTRKMSESMKGKTQSPEQVARRVFSRRIGKKNYAIIEKALIWDGEGLVNIDEIMEEIMWGTS